MRQVLSLMILGALFGCAASSETAPTVVAAAAPASAASDAAAKQICERQPVMGSYRTQLVCYTPGGPGDPNASRTAEDLQRQMGQATQMMGRAGH